MIAALVPFEAVRVGIMGDIQPVPCPSFTILRRCEHAIDEAFPSIWVCICREFIDIVGSWRNPQQIVAQSSNQCLSSCPLERFDPVGRHGGGKEPIDRTAIECVGLSIGWYDTFVHGLPGPVIQSRVSEGFLSPWSLGIDETTKGIDLLVAQSRTIRGHARIVFGGDTFE